MRQSGSVHAGKATARHFLLADGPGLEAGVCEDADGLAAFVEGPLEELAAAAAIGAEEGGAVVQEAAGGDRRCGEDVESEMSSHGQCPFVVGARDGGGDLRVAEMRHRDRAVCYGVSGGKAGRGREMRREVGGD